MSTPNAMPQAGKIIFWLQITANTTTSSAGTYAMAMPVTTVVPSTITTDVPAAITPSNAAATFSVMTMSGKMTVLAALATITANTTTTSAGTSVMNMPNTSHLIYNNYY